VNKIPSNLKLAKDLQAYGVSAVLFPQFSFSVSKLSFEDFAIEVTRYLHPTTTRELADLLRVAATIAKELDQDKQLKEEVSKLKATLQGNELVAGDSFFIGLVIVLLSVFAPLASKAASQLLDEWIDEWSIARLRDKFKLTNKQAIATRSLLKQGSKNKNIQDALAGVFSKKSS